jgi:pyrroline-5-carboxylate reductase
MNVLAASSPLAGLHIAFIGGGNMARSLVGGLVQKGCRAGDITVADPDPKQLEILQQQFAVQVTADNREAAAAGEVLLFAVKPQVFRNTVLPLAELVKRRQPLVISIAAGIGESDIRRWLGGRAAVVRVMPNTPALVGAGAAVLFANADVTPTQRTVAQTLLEAVGLALWIEDEALMDAVTAVSASGPAYFFLFMELMEATARELQLPADVARRLVLQTAYGAARMALATGEDVAVLRRQVTSPGGTTAAALKVFEAEGLGTLVMHALTAARDRGRELARESAEETP